MRKGDALMQKTWVSRFQNRKAAAEFAKKVKSKVERCLKYSDGSFPYQVVYVKEVSDND